MFNERINPETKVRIVNTFRPTVIISAEALARMQLYVDECSDEIGWLGTAYQDGTEFFIQDVFMFEQDVHGATTEITPDGLSSFAEELLQREDGMDIWNNIKVWGHSHVKMTVTPSSQDDKQMEFFKTTGFDWFIRIIANKLGDLRIDIYDYKLGVSYDNVPWQKAYSDEEIELVETINALEARLRGVQSTLVASLKDEVSAEVKAKVRKMYPTYYGGGSNYGLVTGMAPAGSSQAYYKFFKYADVPMVGLYDDGQELMADYFVTGMTLADANKCIQYAKWYLDKYEDMFNYGLEV